MIFPRTTLLAVVGVALVAFVGDFTNAAVYENKAVCAQFQYKPFKNTDFCLNCCQQAGYTEKGQEVGQKAPCTCKGEKARPEADDEPIKSAPTSSAPRKATVYENNAVCAQFQYKLFKNTDFCLNCCKQAGYTEKGQEVGQKAPCTCRGEKVNPDGDDKPVKAAPSAPQPPQKATIYENKVVCAQFLYSPFKNVDFCLNCCKEAGYTEKGHEDSQKAPCSCRGERANPDADDEPIEEAPSTPAPKKAVVYENKVVCAQFLYNPFKNVDYCLNCCKEAGYSEKGHEDGQRASCSCRGERTSPDADDEPVETAPSTPEPKKATVYENKVVCAQFLYSPFKNVDFCLNCCKEAGYTEKGHEDGQKAPCSCRGERANPDADDEPVEGAPSNPTPNKAVVYENRVVCAQFLYNPFKNVDYCMNCCKEAGYTEKGQEVGQRAPCSCRAEKTKPDSDDQPADAAATVSVPQAPERVLPPNYYIYENSKVCRQLPYTYAGGVDQCLQCCREAGYANKGQKDYNSKDSSCTCEVAQRPVFKKPTDVLVAGQVDPVANPKLDGKPTWYENVVVCRKTDYYPLDGLSDACLDCCKRNGYTNKGTFWSVAPNGACTCKASRLKQGRNEMRVLGGRF